MLTQATTVTQAEHVKTIGDALGRNIVWEEIPRTAVQDRLAGVPDTALDTWASFLENSETTTVQKLIGTPRAFAGWARDHTEELR